MNNPIQLAVLSACREFMRPIARLLLKSGVSYRDFSEVCKSAFVEVASDDHGIRGRKTNMSRVAVMTGLTRKEVRKVRDTLESGKSTAMFRPGRPGSVLSIWHSNPTYLDKQLKPKRIPFDGPGANFKDLVAAVGGDIPPKAMLNELLRAGSVVHEGTKLRAVSRSYVPESNNPDAVLLAGSAMRDLASTLYHNLSCKESDERFIERRVFSLRLPRSQSKRFRKLARDKGELLLNDLNTWLSERENATRYEQAADSGGVSPRVGVGIYYFEDTSQQVAPKSTDSNS